MNDEALVAISIESVFTFSGGINMEIVMLKDSDWSQIEDEPCRATEFISWSVIQNGKVRSLRKDVPYASITLECKKIPSPFTAYITHKVDFMNLWAAFKERPLGQDEEVLIAWRKGKYKGLRQLLSPSLPGLWVMVCKKEAFELITDDSFKPSLQGEARAHAMMPIAQWKPDLMP